MKKNVRNLSALGLMIIASCANAYDISFEMDDLDRLADKVEWHYLERTSADVTPQMVLDFICSPPLCFQTRLQNDLYLFTFPGNRRRRSLLDYPFNVLHDYCMEPCGLTLNSWYFYNQTRVDNFTQEGTTLTSYWNLTNENLIGNLDEFEFGIKFPDAVQLFGLLKMQERRTGFMFGGFYNGECGWNIEAKIPVYYNERNFFLTPEEKMLLENSIFFDENDSGFTDESEIHKHFVSDAVGLGDTRVSAGLLIVDQENFGLNVGFEMTFPTAVAFARGLLGTNFAQNSEHPPFDLLTLFQLALGTPPNIQAVTDMSIAFITSAFDKLSANLVQVEMGNSGHIGAAFFFENYLPLNQRFEIFTRGAVEYLFPATEKRFYITKKFPQQFAAFAPYTTDVTDCDNQGGADPADAAPKLAFLNEQLINTFIPFVFPTSIYPGFLVKFTSELIGNFGDTWRFGIGYDLWWQDKEKLGRIQADPLIISNIRTDIASRPGAFQNKFFVTAAYYTEGRWFDWYLTAYGDYTILRTGIGKDFTLALRFTANL